VQRAGVYQGVRALWITVATSMACSSPDRPLAPQPHPIDVAISSIDAAVSPPIDLSPPVPNARLPDLASPLAYDLHLDIDPSSERFHGSVEIRVRLTRATDRVWLHAERLDFDRARYRIGQREAPLTSLGANDHAIHGFAFDRREPAGEVVLAFDYTGKIVDNHAEGLFRQRVAGAWYVYAQSESVFARRILPCFDEPRYKPTWKVTLTVPGTLVALGNGAVEAETAVGDRKEVRLAEVARMPSYLLSVAVGPFAIVDVGPVGRASVPARVVIPAPDRRRVGVVASRLPAIVDALEHYVDRPLPLAKLDLVGVPRFFGAMENVGLVTFESAILTGDPKKPWQARRFIRFAAHELAHQWFGNTVTPAWWDDLWLSEGFATWLGDKTADQLGASSDPALRRALARMHALQADAEDLPRPLRRPLDAEDVEERFDDIAYEKGGAVLAMLERFVGADPFRDAMRGYLRAHAGGNATSRDVVDALGGAAGAGDALRSYLDIAGAPVVTIAVHCATRQGKTRSTIDLRAKHGTIPVCVRYPDGSSEVRACAAATPTAGSIEVAGCPAWVIGNAGGDGYYHVADPVLAASAPLTPSERVDYASDLAAGLVRGDVTLATALAEIAAGVARDPVSRFGAVTIAEAIDPLVDDAVRPAWTRWLAARFAKRPYATRLAVAPPMVAAIEAEATGRLRDLRSPVPGNKAAFDKIVARARALPEDRQDDLLEDLGSFGPPFAVPVVELYLGGTFTPSRVWPAVSAMLERTATRIPMWHALRDRMTRVIATLPAGDLDHLIDATHVLCDPTSRAEVVKVFSGAVPDPNRLARPLAAIDRCIARRARLGDLAVLLQP